MRNDFVSIVFTGLMLLAIMLLFKSAGLKGGEYIQRTPIEPPIVKVNNG